MSYQDPVQQYESMARDFISDSIRDSFNNTKDEVITYCDEHDCLNTFRADEGIFNFTYNKIFCSKECDHKFIARIIDFIPRPSRYEMDYVDDLDPEEY